METVILIRIFDGTKDGMSYIQLGKDKKVPSNVQFEKLHLPVESGLYTKINLYLIHTFREVV